MEHKSMSMLKKKTTRTIFETAVKGCYTFSTIELGLHPIAAIETTCLSSVSLPEAWLKVVTPKVTIDSGVLSSLQLQSVIYSCQRHDQKLPDGSRAGYLIGDGAGFGKGRIAAGIILINYMHGRKKAVWLSVSSDLQYDAQRDLCDTADNQITIFNLKKVKRLKFSADLDNSLGNGVVFSTYLTLAEQFRFNGKTSTRLDQLLDWCGENYDGVIIFDECHQTSRLVHSGRNVLQAVLQLQKKLPNARVVYMCATGVSDPGNMAFMSRLGFWGMDTSFREFKHFFQTIKNGGVGSTELVAMEMKQRGMYMARQLSFENVKFKMVEVSSSATLKFVILYDHSVKLWVKLKQSFAEAEELSNTDLETRKTMWDCFWLAHFNFFKHLCISAKVMDAVKIANASLKSGKSVVIGVQTTGESHTLEQMNEGGELSDFFSTCRSILLSLVEKHFPVLRSTSKDIGRKRKSVLPVTREFKRRKIESTGTVIEDSDSDYPVFDYDSDVDIEDSEDSDSEESEDEIEERLKLVSSRKDRLLTQIEKLAAKFPKYNLLDQLIDQLGGPEKVAEISSRHGRIVQKDNGKIHYESRSEACFPLKFINIREKELFMIGEKNIAVVSERASNGISLQADQQVTDQRKRVYIALELPSSVDIAIQQFGRTCRCNQVSSPEYFLLYSDLAGEKRFASIVAKRLKSLGAFGLDDDRSFGIGNSNHFCLETEYGHTALDTTVQNIINFRTSRTIIVPPPRDYQGDFFSDVKKALVGVGLISIRDNNTYVFKKKTSVSEFLKRILGVAVKLQIRIYKYFNDTLTATISRAQRKSEFHGTDILDWGIGQDVRRTKLLSFTTQYPTGPQSTAKIELHSYEFDQGMLLKTLNVLCGPILLTLNEIASINSESMQVVRVHLRDIRIIGLVISDKCFVKTVELLVKHYGNPSNL